MPMRDYVALLRSGAAEARGLYLKDWHVRRGAPEGAPLLGKTPACFADDWLGLFWQQCEGGADDYHFAYLGPPQSQTPPHHDVLRSNRCGTRAVPARADRLGSTAALAVAAAHPRTHHTPAPTLQLVGQRGR